MKLKTKRVKVWCVAETKSLEWLGMGKKAFKKAPKKLRCPYCNRQLQPLVLECHDWGCWHLYLPAHKKLIKPIKPIKPKK